MPLWTSKRRKSLFNDLRCILFKYLKPIMWGGDEGKSASFCINAPVSFSWPLLVCAGTHRPVSTVPVETQKPQIITDDKTGSVLVLIGGREILTVDAKGIHVKGDIDYSGAVRAGGEAGHAK